MNFRVLPMLLLPNVAASQTLLMDELATLPSVVIESSGIEVGPNGWFWTHNDSDNPSELFCIDTTGAIHRTVNVIGDVNVDWEELTKDDDGNLYIGNFGNNLLNRTDLHIVKIPSIDTCTVNSMVSDTIRFSYPDQVGFPPVGGYGNFDMEAMFWHSDSLHLFSKDRSDPASGYTKHYRLPSENGNYVATLIDSFNVGNANVFFAITSADISESGDSMVLLAANKIYLFSNFTGTDYFEGNISVLDLPTLTQKEAVCFRNGFLYLTDELAFGIGGKLYRLHPSVFVGISELDNELQFNPIYKSDLTFERIELLDGFSVNWKLFSTDGKLISSGTSESRILASELCVQTGTYVIWLTTGDKSKSILIRL